MELLNATLAAEKEKLLACIHCGLCLEACPTYVLTGDENDGPRGRLYLMRAVNEGRLANDGTTFARHIDRCLGCRACEQVCPAGVQYGELLEASRSEIFHSSTKRGLIYKILRLILRHIWLQPARLKLAFRLSRFLRDALLARLLLKSKIAGLISPRFEFALALLESSGSGQAKSGRKKQPDKADYSGEKGCALVFNSCVTKGLFPEINKATERVLQINGYQIKEPAKQVCCGALHAHAGDLEGARRLARQNVEAFVDQIGTIVTNAGGCGAMLLSYEHLLTDAEPFAELARRFSSRVLDVSQLLESGDIREGAALGKERVTYDASCHLLYGQHAGDAPLKMLASIPGLDFVPLSGAERCCGGAGIYNLVEREMSRRVLEEKMSCIKDSGAQILATGNPGCQMQLGAGALLCALPLRVCHPVQLLDESYRNAGYYAEA